MFKIGEVVVYNQYICKIIDIKINNDTKAEYYVMNPIDDESLIINVPKENKLDNIKKIITKEEALNFIKEIPNIDILDINDKYIEQKYKELMLSGSKDDLIKIIKTTYLRNYNRKSNNKKISEKDDNFFKKAENLLYNELSYSLSLSYDEVKEFIIEYCNKK